MAGTTGKWVHALDGGLVALDHIEEIYVWPKDGPDAYEVLARMVSGAKAVLFEHRSKAVCEEWLDKFAREKVDVLPLVVLARRCPNCNGTGDVSGPDPSSKEPCTMCGGGGAVTLEVYEKIMAERRRKP